MKKLKSLISASVATFLVGGFAAPAFAVERANVNFRFSCRNTFGGRQVFIDIEPISRLFSYNLNVRGDSGEGEGFFAIFPTGTTNTQFEETRVSGGFPPGETVRLSGQTLTANGIALIIPEVVTRC